MTMTQSALIRRWQELAATSQHNVLNSARAKLRQIDEEIDYSYQQSMEVFVSQGPGRQEYENPEISAQDEIRAILRDKRYDILVGLFGRELGRGVTR